MRRALRFARVYGLSIWIVTFTLAVTFLLWHGATVDDRLEAVSGQLAVDAERNVAAVCLRSWRVHADVTDMAEWIYRRNAQTLIAVADARPEVVEAYREQVEADVVEIHGRLAEPDCDQEEARALLERSES